MVHSCTLFIRNSQQIPSTMQAAQSLKPRPRAHFVSTAYCEFSARILLLLVFDSHRSGWDAIRKLPHSDIAKSSISSQTVFEWAHVLRDTVKRTSYASLLQTSLRPDKLSQYEGWRTEFWGPFSGWCPQSASTRPAMTRVLIRSSLAGGIGIQGMRLGFPVWDSTHARMTAIM